MFFSCGALPNSSLPHHHNPELLFIVASRFCGIDWRLLICSQVIQVSLYFIWDICGAEKKLCFCMKQPNVCVTGLSHQISMLNIVQSMADYFQPTLILLQVLPKID